MGEAPPKTVRIERDAPEPFETLEQAGAGGMGTVYRARDRKTGELLAVKVLRDVTNDITRFALESDILAKLRHPNIVEYRYHGLTLEGFPYLAMEWIDGDSLEQKLLDGGNLSVDETLRLARSVADALAYAHDAGIIHRDLKPTNILLTKEKALVKLVDFGIARSETTTGLTQTGQALGTPGYMAPEQARGLAVDERADLFALGCVMFRCLGGRRPFGGSDLMQFATQLALHDAPRLREIAPHTPIVVESLVGKLLQKDPNSRPETARDVRNTIDRILNEADATTPHETQKAPEIEKLAIESTLPAPVVERRPIPMAAESGPTKISGSSALTGPPSPAAGPPPPTLTPVRMLIGSLIVIAASAVGLLTASKSKKEADTMPPVAPVVSAAPSASASGAKDANTSRGMLDRACRQWASVIARGQRSDGSFAGEVRADPTGWDTAQQLYALTRSRQACDDVGPNPIASAVRALGELRVADGWVGPSKLPIVKRISATPANAWAVLALDAAGHDVPAAAKLAATARADLLKAKNEDGGFRFQASKPGPSMAYATLLAAWALESDPPARAAAVAWLKKEALANGEGLREPGFTEQVAWFLASSKANALKGEPELASALVADVIAHCRLSQNGCAMPPRETGKVAAEPSTQDGGGKLITFWHPWSTAASLALVKQDPDRAEAKELEVIGTWGVNELGRSIDSLAAIQEYKLAEYLIVVSELLLAK